MQVSYNLYKTAKTDQQNQIQNTDNRLYHGKTLRMQKLGHTLNALHVHVSYDNPLIAGHVAGPDPRGLITLYGPDGRCASVQPQPWHSPLPAYNHLPFPLLPQVSAIDGYQLFIRHMPIMFLAAPIIYLKP